MPFAEGRNEIEPVRDPRHRRRDPCERKEIEAIDRLELNLNPAEHHRVNQVDHRPLDFVVTVGWDFDREALSVMVVPGAASAAAKTLVGPVLTLITHPIGSPADITNSALFIAHKLRSTINNRLTGVGAAVGDPNIRAGAVIRLDGLGPDFSGDYRVVAATHTVDRGGYRTDFKVRKEIIP